MNKLIPILIATCLLAACQSTNSGHRTAGGALIGAGTGTAIGAIAGGGQQQLVLWRAVLPWRLLGQSQPQGFVDIVMIVAEFISQNVRAVTAVNPTDNPDEEYVH